MENASKALIIAGAILISILIIAIGIYIYSSSTNSINTGLNSMSTQEKETFNNDYIIYEGEHKSGAQVKSLISKAIANAKIYEDEIGKIVGIDCKKKDGSNNGEPATKPTKKDDISTPSTGYVARCNEINGKITAKAFYKVELDYNQAGIVDKITITAEQ